MLHARDPSGGSAPQPASVHPSSVNSRVGAEGWSSPFLVFHERVRTSKVLGPNPSPNPNPNPNSNPNSKPNPKPTPILTLPLTLTLTLGALTVSATLCNTDFLTRTLNPGPSPSPNP